MTGKCCVNLVSTFILGGFYLFFFKAKEQSKTESSGFVFNKKPYHFYFSILKMLFHEECFNCWFLFWAVLVTRLHQQMQNHILCFICHELALLNDEAFH